jgi:hypothetical protein
MRLLLFSFLTAIGVLAFGVLGHHLVTSGNARAGFIAERLGVVVCIAGAIAMVFAAGSEGRLWPRILAGTTALLLADAFSQVLWRNDYTFVQTMPSAVAAGCLVVCSIKVIFSGAPRAPKHPAEPHSPSLGGSS